MTKVKCTITPPSDNEIEDYELTIKLIDGQNGEDSLEDGKIIVERDGVATNAGYTVLITLSGNYGFEMKMKVEENGTTVKEDIEPEVSGGNHVFEYEKEV